jgi:hypothetical protein
MDCGAPLGNVALMASLVLSGNCNRDHGCKRADGRAVPEIGSVPSSRSEKRLGRKPIPQRLALGATFLLPKTVGDFPRLLRGIPFVLREPGMLGLREALRIIFRHKS